LPIRRSRSYCRITFTPCRTPVSRKLHDRNEKLSPAIRDIAWKGQIRLCSRYRRLAAAGKPKVVVTTAIAREMVGFIWVIARIAQPTLQG
jgi:transposase